MDLGKSSGEHNSPAVSLKFSNVSSSPFLFRFFLKYVVTVASTWDLSLRTNHLYLLSPTKTETRDNSGTAAIMLHDAPVLPESLGCIALRNTFPMGMDHGTTRAGLLILKRVVLSTLFRGTLLIQHQSWTPRHHAETVSTRRLIYKRRGVIKIDSSFLLIVLPWLNEPCALHLVLGLRLHPRTIFRGRYRQLNYG